MAVPARKVSKNAKRSRRGGQGGLKTPAIHQNENGIYVRNHHVASDGTYKGKQVVAPK
ncbi:50S ribosomal protein L32 [Weissella oryzae SG25]|uniref:Large ribosomal subunit protein bL32 n=1 Tax=Weissella oryzae (strain DSM 25784 / JCM 18191 / LMG 30913 / SG25) TaxID=1329250 RepID=A0A069D1Y3_WEIOS|nr:50S ribosomal protein L32 [Weissella oryzae]GAK31371.1 50S ribosomal protein L32 [Weissella oryzae SG25]